MPRAVILTALKVEYLAVRSHLQDIQECTHPIGTVYEQGRFTSNACNWDVCIVEVGIGNSRAAFEAERAINFFHPEVVLFVGVAGGIKDVRIGDVVASTKIYNYESGKEEESFCPRPQISLSDYRLEQRARAEAKKQDWLKLLPSDNRAIPKVIVAPIAAGEKVVASTKSRVFSYLKTYYGDAVAVEMEGFGMLNAVHSNSNVSAIVIRGISDLIDNKSKSDRKGTQKLASQHASAFAFQVLSELEKSVLSMNQDTYLKELFEILLQIEALNTQEGRDILLRNLPQNPASAIRRSNSKTADINNIINAVSAWGKLNSGQPAIATLAQNSLILVQGTEAEQKIYRLIHYIQEGG